MAHTAVHIHIWMQLFALSPDDREKLSYASSLIPIRDTTSYDICVSTISMWGYKAMGQWQCNYIYYLCTNCTIIPGLAFLSRSSLHFLTKELFALIKIA